MKKLIKQFEAEFEMRAITNVKEFRRWLEKTFNKKLDRPLFISVGKSKPYKLLYDVTNCNGNRNEPCYYYTENPKTIREFSEMGHILLDDWIKGVEQC